MFLKCSNIYIFSIAQLKQLFISQEKYKQIKLGQFEFFISNIAFLFICISMLLLHSKLKTCNAQQISSLS